MTRLEQQPVERLSGREVDKLTTELKKGVFDQLKHHPELKKAQEKMKGGQPTNFFIHKEGETYTVSFECMETNEIINVKRTVNKASGFRQQEARIVVEKPIGLFGKGFKFFDLSSLSYTKDGITVFNNEEAFQGAKQLINGLK